MDWCRLWHDMPTDPKFRTIAKRANRPLAEVLSVFVVAMTNASANANERGRTQGWSHDDVAAALDMETEHVAAIWDAMQGKLLDGEMLTGWEKRQPKREDGASERAKAWRERKRTQANATERPDSDSDKEKKSPLTPLSDQNGVQILSGSELSLVVGADPDPITPAVMLQVCKEHGLSTAEPLLDAFRAWKPRQRPRREAAVFRRWARTHLARNGTTRQLCQPLADIAAAPVIAAVARPSQALLRSLPRSAHARH